MRFKNGKYVRSGPSELIESLKDTKRHVQTVAFGEDFDDYFVMFEDGGYEFSGCPEGFDSLITSRGKRRDYKKSIPRTKWGMEPLD